MELKHGRVAMLAVLGWFHVAAGYHIVGDYAVGEHLEGLTNERSGREMKEIRCEHHGKSKEKRGKLIEHLVARTTTPW